MRTRAYLRFRAFSLAELVCILIIISTLAAIAAPRLSGVLARQRVNAAAERVAVDLALARHQARRTSVVQEVKFEPTNHSYELTGMPDPDRSGKIYAVDVSGEPYGATLDAVVLGGGKTVTFDHFGIPDLTTNGTIRLRVGVYVKDVEVDHGTGVAEVLE